MNFISVCSGIEATSQAFTPYGWNPLWFSEIEPFPCRHLKHRYPGVPNLGDMTKYEDWPDADVDALFGGTPCQSFSVAGLRKGLDDPRGNLMLTYGAIAARYRPRWLVWENVPGVLSSANGRDFGSFLGLLTGRKIEPPKDGWGNSGIIPGIADAYGVAWRVLDSQYVRTRRFRRAVPQRRRRVWVVGYIGDWRRAAAVLFDRESLSGHPPPRREAGERLTRGFECGPSGGGITDVSPTLDTRCKDGPIRNQLGVGVICANSGEVGYCLRARGQQSLDGESETILAVAHALRGEGFDASEDGTGRGTPIVPVAYRIAGDGAAYEEGSIAAPLTTGTDKSASAVAFQERGRESGRSVEWQENVAYALTAPKGGGRSQERNIAMSCAVRRLTPRECERLQGFPDDATDVPNGNKPAADGPRYKAIGNSWAVNCADWIAERMTEVDTWTD